MQLVCSIYVGFLFFVLTPGILLSLPKKGSKYMVAATHALFFAAIYYFTHRMVLRIEGFGTYSSDPKNNDTLSKPPCTLPEYEKFVKVSAPNGTKMEKRCTAPFTQPTPQLVEQCKAKKAVPVFSPGKEAWGC